MIDLLSPYRKKRVDHESGWRLLVSFFSLMTLMILLLSATLYLLNRISAEIVSEEMVRLEERESELSLGGVREGEIRAFNDTILDLESIYRDSLDVIGVIESLREALPSGSRIDSFRYDRSFDDQENVVHGIIISGYAPEWRSLLEIESALEERFKEVTFSPGVWTQLSDIVFSINLKVK